MIRSFAFIGLVRESKRASFSADKNSERLFIAHTRTSSKKSPFHFILVQPTFLWNINLNYFYEVLNCVELRFYLI